MLIDLQAKILDGLPSRNNILEKNRALLEGARVLGIPQIFTEQNPNKLGPTTPDILSRTPVPSAVSPHTPQNHQWVYPKMTFSALGAPGLQDRLEKSACRSVIVTGIETHICIQQSCLDLAQQGFRVGVVADATGAGTPCDHDLALRRMARRGIEILSVESILMEWTRSADHPVFREISGILKRGRQIFCSR